jgi:hypothetical protein
MARPTKLTPRVQETLRRALRSGASFKAACAAAGVAQSTVFEWLARGRGLDPRRAATAPYVALAEAVDSAERFAPQTEGTSSSGFAEFANPHFPTPMKRTRARVNMKPERPSRRTSAAPLSPGRAERRVRSEARSTVYSSASSELTSG